MTAHIFNYVNRNILKKKLNNKFNYKKTKSIPSFKNIKLSINNKAIDSILLFKSFLALELIAFTKAVPISARNPSVLSKIRKGQPVGCKVKIKKSNNSFFLSKINSEFYNDIKTLKSLGENFFTFKSKNATQYFELSEHYNIFKRLKIQTSIITSAKTKPENFFLFKTFKFF